MLKQFVKLYISGRVANDPLLEFTPTGKARLKFGVFVNIGGESNYYYITAWENNAKYIVDRIEKGDSISFEGILKGTFYGENENKKYSPTIVLTDVIAFEKKTIVAQEGGKIE